MRAGVFLGSFYGAKLPRITNTGSPVSEKNSSRKLGDQACYAPVRYLRGSLLGSLVGSAQAIFSESYFARYCKK
jgi:hypothetical protein